MTDIARFMGEKILEFVDFFVPATKSSLQGFLTPPSRFVEHLPPVTMQPLVPFLNNYKY